MADESSSQEEKVCREIVEEMIPHATKIVLESQHKNGICSFYLFRLSFNVDKDMTPWMIDTMLLRVLVDESLFKEPAEFTKDNLIYEISRDEYGPGLFIKGYKSLGERTMESL